MKTLREMQGSLYARVKSERYGIAPLREVTRRAV